MLIRNKFYPYPVVAKGNDSYNKSEFTSHVDAQKSGYNIKLELNAKINNDKIKELIEEKKACFVHHIECAQTCFRNALITQNETEVCSIHQNKINGRVTINSMIVAMQDIDQYENDDFSTDYRGFKFDIKKGCLLALGEGYEFEFNKQRDDLGNTSSIFVIIPILENKVDEDIIKVEISSIKSKIEIHMPDKQFNIYKKLSQNPEFQCVMHSMIIIPALIQVFDELKSSGEIYNYELCRWYKSLVKACENIDIVLNEKELKVLNSYEVAQKLMDSPTKSALKFLVGGENYED